MIKFTIKGNPTTKKNSQQIKFFNKKPYITQSDKYKTYEQKCLWLMPKEIKNLKINKPINIKALYYRDSQRKVDITNLHSALHDILVKAKVIADDSSFAPRIVVSTDGSRVLYDKINPRTEVEITEVLDEKI